MSKSNFSRRRIALTLYVLSDIVMSVLSWGCFFILRKSKQTETLLSEIVFDSNFLFGIIIIPTCWILLYALFEEYTDIYRKSRLTTFTHTFFYTLLGSLLIFFFLILDDIVVSYHNYYYSFLTLFGLQFGLIAMSRMVILGLAKRDVKNGIVMFNTLLLGNNERAMECYSDIVERPKSLGYNFVGYLDLEGNQNKDRISDRLPYLGKLKNIEKVASDYQIEEVIVALDDEQVELKRVLSHLFALEKNVLIKIIPHLYDILLGHVKMNHLYGAVLIEIEREIMPRWQRIVKRLFDICTSAIILTLLSPLLLVIGLRVRLSSPGAIIYKQLRVGQGGKEFWMYKFRSMYMDAEKEGPMLSQEGDHRITAWGSVMRKYRLDELPQFWNVLKGDMSIVGPRPERRYYIDQIIQRAPHYNHLLKVRPGITSWGMVKYGYASTIEEMIQRLKFDLLYIENRSLALDFKIMFYTALVILKGDGK